MKTLKLKKIIKISFFIFLVPLFFIQGQTVSKPGVTAAQFLKIGVSARAEAMGQSVVSFIDDASSVYYNPAGLMNIESSDVVFGYTFMPAGVGVSLLSVARRISTNDAVAVSGMALRSDEMKVRTILQPEGTGENFYVADYAFSLHYAHNYTMDLKIGFTLRYLFLNQVSGIFSKSSWSADMGIQYNTGIKGLLEGLRIGMLVANFGPEVKFINESYGLPLKYVVGVSKPININDNNQFLITTSWVKAIDEKQKAQLGFEYNFNNMISVRAGYKFASDSESWSGGIGIRKNTSLADIRVDYSYNAFGILGNLHRITAGLGF